MSTRTKMDNRTIGYLIVIASSFLLFGCQNIVTTELYSITYYSNESKTGIAPTDCVRYSKGETAIVLGNTGFLTKDGFYFNGWNTKSDGTGINYTEGQKIIFDKGNINLFAHWDLVPTFKITYFSNESTSGTIPVDMNEYREGQNAVVLGNIGNLNKNGTTFCGWNTKPDGSGASYKEGQSISITSSNINLYALWVVNIKYNGNGNESGSVPVDNNNYPIGSNIAICGNTGYLIKAGYNFVAWNTSADGSGQTYSTGMSIEQCQENTDLYAIWIPISLKYTVSYNTITITGMNGTMPDHLAIPGGVNIIGDSAFAGCSTIVSLSLPASVVKIGYYAFKGCINLISCETISGSLVPMEAYVIYGSAFMGCSNLQTITLPNCITQIYDFAFKDCTKLTSVTIPPHVRYFYGSIFENCTSLSTLDLPVGLSTIGNKAFLGCTNLANIIIPASVSVIGGSAFRYCSSLKTITVPANVTTVWGYSFSDCTALTDVFIKATTPPSLPIGSHSFDNCSSTIIIHVPSGCLDAYRSSSGWNEYNSILSY